MIRVLAEGEQNGRGMVYYEPFAKRAIQIIDSILYGDLKDKVTEDGTVSTL